MNSRIVFLSAVAAGLLVVSVSAGPALLDGPEFLVDTTRHLIPTPTSQANPTVAFDGTNYLAVWRDDDQMKGAFVTPSGTLVEPAGFSILSDIHPSPRIAWGGGVYLLVYEVWLNNNSDIYGLRVDAGGTVLDPVGFPIVTVDLEQDDADVAFDGTNFLVVWTDERAGGDSVARIHGARVSPGGQVLDPDGFAITQGPFSQSVPAVAFDGNNYFVAWGGIYDDTAYYNIWGARVSPQGQVLDPDPILVCHQPELDHETPDVAFNGTNYLVAWQYSSSKLIYCTRVTPAGTVLDTADIRVAGRPDPCEYPRVHSDGTGWLVTWADDIYSSGQNLYAARIAADGTSLDPSGFPVCNEAFTQGSGAISHDGTNYLVAWLDGRNGIGKNTVYAGRVTSAGARLDSSGFAVSWSVNEQAYPGIASDGTDYLVVWRDDLGAGDIHGARVDEDGNILDPEPFAICQAPWEQTKPAAAFDGTNYLVVWGDERDTADMDIYAARVTTSGTVLDPDGFLVADRPYSDYLPGVSWNGQQYLVTWTSAWYHTVWGALVNPDGTVPDTAFQVSYGRNTQIQSRSSPGDSNWLVVWIDAYYSVYGTQVTFDGRVTDTLGFEIIADSANMYPGVAFDGTNWFVTWQDRRRRHGAVYGSRVDQSGQVLDPGGIAIGVPPDTFRAAYPDLVFDGTNYLVVWADTRRGTRQWHFGIQGAEVSPAGTVLSEFPVVVDPGRVWSLALGHSGQQAMLAFCLETGEVNGRTYDGTRVWGKMGPLPGVEEERMTPDAGRFTLYASPNPFSGSTVLRVASSVERQAPIRIYDSGGRLVRVFGQSSFDNRHSALSWDGTGDAGRRLANGVYFCRMEADRSAAGCVLVLMK